MPGARCYTLSLHMRRGCGIAIVAVLSACTAPPPPPAARSGKPAIAYTAPAADEAAGFRPYRIPGERPPQLIFVYSGSLRGRRMPIRAPVVNGGRADFNDIVVAEPSVSTTHA